VGTITAISGNALTVKSDAGEVRQVEVPAEAAIKRIAPGQKDLSTAETLQFSDLATGDRVLVKLDPDVTGPVVKAIQIVAIKQTDVAQKQQKDREDWQQRGTGGPVKSVDSASGVVVLSSGAGAAAKTITVHTTKATLLKRYAPASVRFDTAQPAPIEAIHAGDQLRARGAKNADGTEIAAEEVISGSFRNISGTITSADPSASTLVVKDLATKKQVTIHITPDAQMRRLPDMMARMLATRLKATAGGPVGAKAPQSPAPSDAAHFGGGPGGDPQQMLNRAPAIQLADLKKGDAVMVVSTDGTSEVTAISLLAGVEPLLEAPAAQNLLSNWSMASGAAEAAQ
jgi:transcription antitermination factor NusG